MDVTGCKSEVWSSKEQYCTGIWTVRSMNQDTLDVIKQETARMNTDILGICELNWMGIGKLNLDDHYIYYCGQESHRRNGVGIGMGNTCKPLAVSFQCMTKSTTNKKKKKKKKKWSNLTVNKRV